MLGTIIPMLCSLSFNQIRLSVLFAQRILTLPSVTPLRGVKADISAKYRAPQEILLVLNFSEKSWLPVMLEM